MPPHLLALLLTLPSEAATPSLAAVELAARQHVAERLGLEAASVELLHLGISALPPCAEGARVLVDSAPTERFRGHAELRVDLYGPEELCASLRLRSRVRAWVEHPVAARATRPGEVVQWTVQRIPLERLEAEPIDGARLERGTWLARTSLAEGEPLSALVIRERPDGSSGEAVHVLAGHGSLLIESQGRLLADAFLGDSVRVANTDTRSVHDGTLIAPGCVATGSVTPRMKEACPDVRHP
jgi:flagella basal body P-ring formation protein FlgA